MQWLSDNAVIVVLAIVAVALLAWPVWQRLAGTMSRSPKADLDPAAFRKKAVMELMTLRDDLEKQGSKTAVTTCKGLIVTLVNGESG